MSREPYRKPAPPPPEKRTVVRRADPPDAGDPEREARNAAYRAQTARVAAELAEAERRAHLAARGSGALLLLFGIFSSVRAAMRIDDPYLEGGQWMVVVTDRALVTAAGALTLGAWLLAFGSGGASSLSDAPPRVRYGAPIAFAVGALAGLAVYRDLLGWLAHMF